MKSHSFTGAWAKRQWSQTGNLRLRWPSVTNRLYTLLHASNSAAPFSVLASNLPAQPPTNTYTDSIHPNTSRFYRLQLQP